jgi:Protein of unknown function (DUF998)
MKSSILNSESVRVSATAARASFAAVIATMLFLASLHVLSPEFDPSWRMVSEYANGRYGWVLSLMFLSWALSTWALAFAIRSQLKTVAGKIGLMFLIAAGVGEALASMFDINHPSLHNLAGFLGILSLPVAAMLITVSVARTEPWSASRKLLLWTANLTWVSLVIMVASLIVMGVTFIRAGGHVPANGKSLPLGATLPPGTIPVVGYANRFLVVAYCAWVIVVAWLAIRLGAKQERRPETETVR